MLAAAGSQERIVNKGDADRIFGLTRPQLEAEAKQMVHPGGWKVRLNPVATGTGLMAFDPKTGTGLSVQPFFRDRQGPQRCSSSEATFRLEHSENSVSS
jgi:hypothetical protein